MKISLKADQRYWLELPHFPKPESGRVFEWQDSVVAKMKRAWSSPMTADGETAVREALKHGLKRVLPDDVVTLQYWPTTSFANVIVHFTAAEFVADEKRQGFPSLDLRYVTQPVTTVVETERLGSGIERRYLFSTTQEPAVTLGGVDYLFANDFGYIAVGMEPTLPGFLGGALEHLREIIQSIEVVEEDSHWTRCFVDYDALPSRGEEWPKEVQVDGRVAEENV